MTAVTISQSDSFYGQYSILGVPPHDYVFNTYTGTNLTQVVYRRGGATGAIVATLVMTYDGSNNLLTVTRTV